MCSGNGTTRTSWPRFVSGYCSACRRTMPSISACACATVTPGRSLATTSSHWLKGRSRESVAETNRGVQKSIVSMTLETPIWKSASMGGNRTGSVAAPRTACRVGPTRERSSTWRSTVLPTTASSASKRRRQTSLPSTRALAPRSSGRKERPSTGTPNTSKNSGVTRSPFNRSLCTPSITSTVAQRYPVIASNDVAVACQSASTPGATRVDG